MCQNYNRDEDGKPRVVAQNGPDGLHHKNKE